MNGFTYCDCGKCESSRRGMKETGRSYSVPRPTVPFNREQWFAKHVETCAGCVECVPHEWLNGSSPSAPSAANDGSVK